MAAEDSNLIPADETVYRLDLTAAELKVVFNAVKSYFDDFGHDERDVHEVVRGVLDKLPGQHEIRAIDLDAEIRKLRALRGA